jgi:hypothetical protein
LSKSDHDQLTCSVVLQVWPRIRPEIRGCSARCRGVRHAQPLDRPENVIARNLRVAKPHILTIQRRIAH